jgi:hypothetical protein
MGGPQVGLDVMVKKQILPLPEIIPWPWQLTYLIIPLTSDNSFNLRKHEKKA